LPLPELVLQAHFGPRQSVALQLGETFAATTERGPPVWESFAAATKRGAPISGQPQLI